MLRLKTHSFLNIYLPSMVICFRMTRSQSPSASPVSLELENCIEPDISDIEKLKTQLLFEFPPLYSGNEYRNRIPFGMLHEDWVRLNLLDSRLPEDSLLRSRLLKAFRLLIVAIYENYQTSLLGGDKESPPHHISTNTVETETYNNSTKYNISCDGCCDENLRRVDTNESLKNSTQRKDIVTGSSFTTGRENIIYEDNLPAGSDIHDSAIPYQRRTTMNALQPPSTQTTKVSKTVSKITTTRPSHSEDMSVITYKPDVSYTEASTIINNASSFLDLGYQTEDVTLFPGNNNSREEFQKQFTPEVEGKSEQSAITVTLSPILSTYTSSENLSIESVSEGKTTVHENEIKKTKMTVTDSIISYSTYSTKPSNSKNNDKGNQSLIKIELEVEGNTTSFLEKSTLTTLPEENIPLPKQKGETAESTIDNSSISPTTPYKNNYNQGRGYSSSNLLPKVETSSKRTDTTVSEYTKPSTTYLDIDPEREITFPTLDSGANNNYASSTGSSISTVIFNSKTSDKDKGSGREIQLTTIKIGTSISGSKLSPSNITSELYNVSTYSDGEISFELTTNQPRENASNSSLYSGISSNEIFTVDPNSWDTHPYQTKETTSEDIVLQNATTIYSSPSPSESELNQISIENPTNEIPKAGFSTETYIASIVPGNTSSEISTLLTINNASGITPTSESVSEYGLPIVTYSNSPGQSTPHDRVTYSSDHSKSKIYEGKTKEATSVPPSSSYSEPTSPQNRILEEDKSDTHLLTSTSHDLEDASLKCSSTNKCLITTAVRPTEVFETFTAIIPPPTKVPTRMVGIRRLEIFPRNPYFNRLFPPISRGNCRSPRNCARVQHIEYEKKEEIRHSSSILLSKLSPKHLYSYENLDENIFRDEDDWKYKMDSLGKKYNIR